MLYLGLMVFGALVVWMFREQGYETRERDRMNEFYRAEYQRVFITTN